MFAKFNFRKGSISHVYQYKREATKEVYRLKFVYSRTDPGIQVSRNEEWKILKNVKFVFFVFFFHVSHCMYLSPVISFKG